MQKCAPFLCSVCFVISFCGIRIALCTAALHPLPLVLPYVSFTTHLHTPHWFIGVVLFQTHRQAMLTLVYMCPLQVISSFSSRDVCLQSHNGNGRRKSNLGGVRTHDFAIVLKFSWNWSRRCTLSTRWLLLAEACMRVAMGFCEKRKNTPLVSYSQSLMWSDVHVWHIILSSNPVCSF